MAWGTKFHCQHCDSSIPGPGMCETCAEIAEQERLRIEAQLRRPSWESYFMDIAMLVAQRSTCRRRKVGAIAVKEKRILATGYNGAPRNLKDCLETGCLREQMGIPSGQRHELCKGIHAEQNVIVQAAVHGVSLEGADIYCTNQPCLICAKMLINCGIRRILFSDMYPDAMSEAMFKEAGVELLFIPNREAG